MRTNELMKRLYDTYYKNYPLKQKNVLNNNDTFKKSYNFSNEKHKYSIEELQQLVDKIINWYESNCLNNNLLNIEYELPYEYSFKDLKNSLPLKLSRILDIDIESYELSDLSKSLLSVIPYGLIYSNSYNNNKVKGLRRAYIFYKDINQEYGSVFRFDAGDIANVDELNSSSKTFYNCVFLEEYFNGCKNVKNGYEAFYKREKQSHKLLNKIFNRYSKVNRIIK